jgi:hypothetical protein
MFRCGHTRRSLCAVLVIIIATAIGGIAVREEQCRPGQAPHICLSKTSGLSTPRKGKLR